MSTTETLSGSLRAVASWTVTVPALWQKLVAELVAWNEAARLRHMARSLDERTLRDIGLSRADIEGAAADLRNFRYDN